MSAYETVDGGMDSSETDTADDSSRDAAVQPSDTTLACGNITRGNRSVPIRIPPMSCGETHELKLSVSSPHDGLESLVCSPGTFRVSLGNQLRRNETLVRQHGSQVPSEPVKRRMRAWVDDHLIESCQHCNKPFNFYTRKHHCRVCGRIFCYSCCNQWWSLPQELVLTRGRILNAPTMLIDWSRRTSDRHRICRPCDLQIRELTAFQDYATVLDLVQLDIRDYSNLACTGRLWNRIARQYLRRFREVQYYLHNRLHNCIERRALFANARLIVGHRLWVTQLLCVCRSVQDLDRVMHLMKKQTPVQSCRQLRCSGTCTARLCLTDIITILRCMSVQSIDYWSHPGMNRLVKQTLRSCAEEDLIATTPWWVRNLTRDSGIPDVLIERAAASRGLATHLFWNIVVATETHAENPVYRWLIRHMLRSIDSTTSRRLKQGYYVGRKLNGLPENPSIRHLCDALHKVSVTYLPTECSGDATLVFPETARITQSANCPVYIPGVFEPSMREPTRRQSSILFKQEDVRVDCIVMNVVRYMNMVLQRNGMDLGIVTYQVVPTSAGSGCIKIVPDSFTLYKIKREFGFTIQNFILEKNPTMSIQAVRARFMRSCAGACVVSFLLGLGDRHLENIMITTDGRLFHIDFDYILGHDSKPFQPEMRITAEMVDAMGGESSDTYGEFQRLCIRAYNCLRVQVDIFSVMLTELTHVNPDRYPRKHVMKQIIHRFMPGETDDSARLQFRTVLHRSSSSRTSSRIADFIHQQHQEHMGSLQGLTTACRNQVRSFSKFLSGLI